MKGYGLYYLVRGEGEGRGGAEIEVGEGGGELERTGGMSSLSLFIVLFCEILYLLADNMLLLYVVHVWDKLCHLITVLYFCFLYYVAFMVGCYVLLRLLLPALLLWPWLL